ncbi:MAG: hypothetical protein R2726_00260 [Acidimicrobiales bacterium]
MPPPRDQEPTDDPVPRRARPGAGDEQADAGEAGAREEAPDGDAEATTEAADRGPRRPPVPDEVPEGEWIVTASLGGTALFTVTALAATAVPEPLVYVSVPVALVLFALGSGAFLLAYWNAVQRSRESLIGIGGLYFLVGCAPARVRNLMNLSLAVEVVVGLVTASIRVFTPLAFGLLVPMWALGLSGLWASRFGVFPPRPPSPPRRGARPGPPTTGRGARRLPPTSGRGGGG